MRGGGRESPSPSPAGRLQTSQGTGAETGPWAAPRLRHRVARAQLGAHAGAQGRCLALSPGRGSKWPQPGSPLSAQILAPKYRSPGTRSSDSWGVARLQGEIRKKRRWARGVSERRSARVYTDSQRRGRVGGRGSPRGTRGLSDTPEDAWPPSGHGQEGRARQSQPPGAWEDAAATVQTMHDRSPGHAHPVTPRLLPSEADASQPPPTANRDSLSTERWVLQMRGDVHGSSGALGTLAPSLPAARLPDQRVPARLWLRPHSARGPATRPRLSASPAPRQRDTARAPGEAALSPTPLQRRPALRADSGH